jgi:hypothetical protein
MDGNGVDWFPKGTLRINIFHHDRFQYEDRCIYTLQESTRIRTSLCLHSISVPAPPCCKYSTSTIFNTQRNGAKASYLAKALRFCMGPE